MTYNSLLSYLQLQTTIFSTKGKLVSNLLSELLWWSFWWNLVNNSSRVTSNLIHFRDITWPSRWHFSKHESHWLAKIRRSKIIWMRKKFSKKRNCFSHFGSRIATIDRLKEKNNFDTFFWYYEIVIITDCADK